MARSVLPVLFFCDPLYAVQDIGEITSLVTCGASLCNAAAIPNNVQLESSKIVAQKIMIYWEIEEIMLEMKPRKSSFGPSGVRSREREKKKIIGIKKKSPSILDQINIDYHAPEGWQKIIIPDKLERLLETGDQVGAHVLVGDIRQSTFLMKESISPKQFAQITRDFMKAIKSTASSNEGWFDKFTGDGFIIYWIYGNDQNKYIQRILAFCQALLSYFPEVMNKYRMNSKNFPAGVGLSLGVDSGLCTLIEIGDLNIIGPPVVGASRMVGAAQSFETLFNVSIGAELYKDRKQIASEHGIRISKKKISTKEYGEEGDGKGQEAYSVQFKK